MRKNILKKLLIVFLVGILAFPQIVFATGNRDWKWPVPASNSLSSCYLDGRSHYALDISAGGGASIYASYPGTVIYTYTGCNYDYGKNGNCPCGSCGNLGNSVYIKHSYNGVSYVSRYGHMRSVRVSVGQTITKDTVIGTVGSTGYSTGNHLDFRIYKGSTTSHVAARDSMDPFKDNFLEMPSGLNANAATTACCKTYVNEVIAQYNNTEHACNKGTYKYYWVSHPHYKCYQCSVCGEINEFHDETTLVYTCDECFPTEKVTFNANGGTLPTERYSDTIDGVNIERPGGSVVVYNSNVSSPGTNKYGAEVAVNSQGKVVSIREYGNEEQLAIPNGGFVLSGNGDYVGGGYRFVHSIIELYKADSQSVYIGLNYATNEIKVFDSYESYIANHKYLAEGERYGGMPIPKRDGYLFDGWFTSPSGGTEYKWSSSYIVSELYAHWVGEDEAKPEFALEDHENRRRYERYDYIMSWEDAEKFCESRGGHLVSITSLEEQELLANFGFLDNTRRGQYFIGATDRNEEGNWKWITGEVFEFSNWDQHVPEPNGGTSENYALITATPISSYSTGEWLDIANTDFNTSHSTCNTGFICEYENVHEHSYVGKVTKQPTCTEKGVKTYSCSCGDHYTEAITATGHAYETIVTEPGCETIGYRTHTCEICGNSYTDSTTDALGHKLGDWTLVQEATCKEGGSEIRSCERCDYEEIQKTAVIDHTYKKVATLPTCEERGYSIYTCKVCGYSYEGDEKEALGHSFTNYISDNNATGDFAGTKTAKCDRCNVTDTIPETSEEVPEIPVNKNVIRLAGSTRYDTGYAVADVLKETLGVDKFEAVVVATGKNFADALAGSYLAVQKNAPIILTNGKDDNVAQLHEYIKANVIGNGTVYILGGEAAVPESVEEISGYTVKRLAGSSRYDTNLEILLEAGISGDEIIVATGKSFADSLSASAAKLPILLVKPNGTLDIAQKAILRNMNKIYIVGGEGAVSSDYEKELAAYGMVERVFGSSRYDTSVEIAKAFCGSVDKMVVASGKNFPDGLCGGPLAAALNVPLILTKDNGADAAIEYAEENTVVGGYVLGGAGALADETVVDVFKLESDQEIK